MSLLELFCHVDDFCQRHNGLWAPVALPSGSRRRQRERSLSLSEVMTILILFHQSHYRHFKAFYTEHVQAHLREEIPGLVSYGRFVEFMPSTLLGGLHRAGRLPQPTHCTA